MLQITGSHTCLVKKRQTKNLASTLAIQKLPRFKIKIRSLLQKTNFFSQNFSPNCI